MEASAQTSPLGQSSRVNITEQSPYDEAKASTAESAAAAKSRSKRRKRLFDEQLGHIRKVLKQRAESVPEVLDEEYLSSKKVTNMALGAVICQRVQGDSAPTNQACRATRSEAIGRILAVQAAALAPGGRKRKAAGDEAERAYRTIMEAEPWVTKRAKKQR